MTLPNIDYKFWYNVNYEVNKSREPGTYINRHHAVATQIFKKYVDEKLRLSYFTQFEDEKKITSEYNRIKSLTYEDLENEILENILEVFLNKFENEEQIIKTFDLIQIWGGRPGGNNIYDRQGIDRVNITDWLKTYIDGIEKASKGKFESYKILKSIKHLQIPFASKHVNFYSRHLKMNSLIIIDEKISHCFKVEDPKSLSEESIKEINFLCKTKANNIGYETWQIEKALFSFHSNYFEAKTLINTNYLNPLDNESCEEINKWYEEIKKIKPRKKTKSRNTSKNENINTVTYTLNKNEFFKDNDNCIFVRNSAIERCKIPNTQIKRGNNIILKGEIFYYYIGNKNLIVII